MSKLGIFKDETCNRNGCRGIISSKGKEGGCSCHISPPCSYCTTPDEYCPECNWDAKEEMQQHEMNASKNIQPFHYKIKEFVDLDRTKIDWIVRCHTHFTQICKGVYPEGTTAAEVADKVRGTFGGRFIRFGNGEFEYVAYTD